MPHLWKPGVLLGQEEEERDFLAELLDRYWFAPSVGLWRAVEIRTAAEEKYAPPILDLGCGDGLVAAVLFGRKGSVAAGCDLWPGPLPTALASGVYRSVQVADGHRLPYPDACFATVFSNSVLEHIPSPAAVVAEVGRALWPGGRFIFTVPSDAFPRFLHFYAQRMASGDRAGAERYVARVNERLAHYHYHTPNEWRELLAAAGLRLLKARYYIPEPVERLWDRMNARFGVGRGGRSLYSLLASPRLWGLRHQRLMRRWVRRTLARRWRGYYEMQVEPGAKGGGLLMVAEKRS